MTILVTNLFTKIYLLGLGAYWGIWGMRAVVNKVNYAGVFYIIFFLKKKIIGMA